MPQYMNLGIEQVLNKPMLTFDYASLYFNTIPLCSYYTNNKNEIKL